MDEKYYANIFTAMPRKLTRRLVWKTSEYRFLPFLYDLKKERIENVYTCNLCENEINVLTNDRIIIVHRSESMERESKRNISIDKN